MTRIDPNSTQASVFEVGGVVPYVTVDDITDDSGPSCRKPELAPIIER